LRLLLMLMLLPAAATAAIDTAIIADAAAIN
jgi:hypothetical protein